MTQFQVGRAPSRIVPRNGFPVPQATPSTLGQIQISPATPQGRENLMKITTSVALAGGAAWALISLPGAAKKNKVALGVLGGGLAATALLSLVDGLS